MDIYDKILVTLYFGDIKHSDVADFIGCARETWNRGFKKKALSKKHLDGAIAFFKSHNIDINLEVDKYIPPEIDCSELAEENKRLKDEVLALYRKLQNTEVATVMPKLEEAHKVATG